MMNKESKTIKPKNDFQLVENYSNHCVWKELRNDSGAGADADAASGVVDTTISATDPLSEIVWSPNKGFSLHCVDPSFSDKNASLYKDVRPSSIVFALLQSVNGGNSNSDTPINDVSVNPITVICTNSGISSMDAPSRHQSDQSGVIIPECKTHKEHNTGPGGIMEKIDAGRGDIDLHNDQKENLMSYCKKNICDQANIGTVIISDTEGNNNKSSATSGQVDKRPVDNFILQADEPKPNMELSKGGMDIGSGNKVVLTEDGLCTKVEHIVEYDGSGALTSSNRSPVEKLESTAENDVQILNCVATYAATSVALVPICDEDQNKSKGNEMMSPFDEVPPVLHSPCNSRIHKATNKIKEKSLFDGNANASLSKKEKDEHSNVKSCYSTGLFLTGKKRCNFQQQLIIGSKRIKKKIQETSCSTSKIKGDSSFMNMISNMMKGLSSKSTHGLDVSPLNFCADNSSFYNQYLQSNEFEASTRAFHGSHENRKTDSVDNKNCYHLRHSKGKEGLALHSSPKEHDKINNENFESFASLFHKSDTPEDLWMTRFSTKSTCPFIAFDHLNEIGGSLVHSSIDRSALSHSHKHFSYLNIHRIEGQGTREQSADDHLLSEAKKLQDCFINKEVSIGLKDHKENNYHTSKHKFNHTTPFSGCKDSEPMASMFARRLGAIKHILADTTDNISHK